MHTTTIDIITVYNNLSQYNTMLASLANSSFQHYNAIALDNTQGRFSSAAQAYNFALSTQCTGDIFVFCHQDILFSENELERIAELCTKEDNTLFGAAGVENKGPSKIIVSSMTDPNVPKYRTIHSKEIKDVFTLDECLIAGNKRVFENIQFDEELCNGWHFYAVEFCLQCHQNGINTKVYDSNISHLSAGKIDASFRECEKRVAKKYRKKYRVLSYPCGWCYTHKTDEIVFRIKRRLKMYLRL